ncbi:MAG: MCE family protein [Chitinophagaceae bacterium]|nr:MCE family protein [Chitinophagaceae bacterium]
MKINNETKIGLLVIVGIVLLIFGFNYLKGKSLFHKEVLMHANFSDVLGLTNSNPVIMNGVQVGKVVDIDGGKDMKQITVTFAFTKSLNIADNSIAVINPNLLGSPSLEIRQGDSPTFLKDGAFLEAQEGSGALDEAMKIINPVLYEVKNAVQSLDSVFRIVNTVFDAEAKRSIKNTLENLDSVSRTFKSSARSLEFMLDKNNGVIYNSLNNINSITGNLSNQNEKIDSIIGQVNTTTARLAAVDLEKTLDTLNMAISEFRKGAEAINSKSGSLGLLLNDKALYNNLESTTHKLNILLDDIRVNPRRYLNISVFGKKDKKDFLTAPLIDDTLEVIKP